MRIQWSDDYNTGVPEIDKQHREIVNQLNRLHEAIISGMGKYAILEIIDFAGNYAKKHFAYEEDCMNKYKCPVAAENKEAHEFFKKRFTEIRDSIDEDQVNANTIIEVYNELSDWIKSHILRIDTNLRSCVLKNESQRED